MLKKRPVILGSSGEYIRELNSVNDEVLLDSGQELIIYTTKSGMDYRADKILEEITASTGATQTFGTPVSTVLFLHILWDTAKAGSDNNGAYVSFGGRRFYANYMVTKADGKPLPSTSSTRTHLQMKVIVQGVWFMINTMTLVYVLFHNFTGFNPVQDNKIAMLRTQDSPVIPEEVVLVDGGAWKANVKALMNSLIDRNLLIRGTLSYYSLVKDEDLGLSLDLSYLEVEEAYATR
jgi:hypothetical protein